MNISITNKCNRRCSYCFQKTWYLANNKEDIKEMSLDKVEQLVNMMGDTNNFNIMGGEPLLHSKIYDILELLRKYKKTVTIMSNITVQYELLEFILHNYNDVVTKWLINIDYPNEHKEVFTKNFKLFYDKDNINLSTTLIPNSYNNIYKAQQLKQLLYDVPITSNMGIRISPQTPNHKDYIIYDYTMDINNVIDIIWSIRKFHIYFDCTLNGCEVHPLLIEKFMCNEEYISWKTNSCRGCGPFDIMVDGTVVYCSSAPFIRLQNIFDYETIEIAKHTMIKQYENYWKHNKLNCNYQTCDFFNPLYCNGLCPAKNYMAYEIKYNDLNRI